MSLWQRMPAHLIKSQILISGGAFKMRYQFGNGKEKPRYFFILKDPTRDDYLFMVTPTRKVRQWQKMFRHDKDALVTIKPSEYNPLKYVSLVDCGSPVIELKADIIAKISKYEIQPLPRLPNYLLERLRDAVALSKRLTSNQKRLVLGEEESTDLPPSEPREPNSQENEDQ